MSLRFCVFWRDVRAVYGAVLERLCTERYRGFESPSLRYSLRRLTATVSESSGPMQKAALKPRQIRKEAAVDCSFLCRSVPGLSKAVS